MKAIWNSQVIAESDKTISIEGNQYFPPDSIKKEFFKESDFQTRCHWKGNASYFDVEVNGETNKNAAWYYPEPLDGSIEKVGSDFTNYLGFWNGVQVID